MAASFLAAAERLELPSFGSEPKILPLNDAAILDHRAGVEPAYSEVEAPRVGLCATGGEWCARQDSNLRAPASEASRLSPEASANGGPGGSRTPTSWLQAKRAPIITTGPLRPRPRNRTALITLCRRALLPLGQPWRIVVLLAGLEP